MKRLAIALVIMTTAISALGVPNAKAEGGEVAAGVAGGLIGGLLLGGALAPRPYYYEPGPVYVQPEPVYVEPPPYSCYWTRGEPYWDDYRGVWRHSRVKVCD
jgi:hypothetical protein